MLGTAVIVFREILEIAIILGVILAATRGIKGRAKWINLGVVLGLIGSGVVAYFIEEISEWSDGLGQEMFNAIILLVAASVIGWTVIWMRTHAKHMTAKLKNVSKKVADGDAHLFSVSIVIALAILREGSEIVLFSNGILLAGKTSIAQFALGAGLGAVGGALVGAMIYFGLIKMKAKYIFKVTSWLLIFLAAGMTSIAAGYLASAGVFDKLVTPVWDISSVLSDDSYAGQFLGILIGYTASPLGIQLVFYAVTLAVLATSVICIERKQNKPAAKPAN
jgi:high-affinity iron transporter